MSSSETASARLTRWHAEYDSEWLYHRAVGMADEAADKLATDAANQRVGDFDHILRDYDMEWA